MTEGECAIIGVGSQGGKQRAVAEKDFDVTSFFFENFFGISFGI